MPLVVEVIRTRAVVRAADDNIQDRELNFKQKGDPSRTEVTVLYFVQGLMRIGSH